MLVIFPALTLNDYLLKIITNSHEMAHIGCHSYHDDIISIIDSVITLGFSDVLIYEYGLRKRIAHTINTEFHDPDRASVIYTQYKELIYNWIKDLIYEDKIAHAAFSAIQNHHSLSVKIMVTRDSIFLYITDIYLYIK